MLTDILFIVSNLFKATHLNIVSVNSLLVIMNWSAYVKGEEKVARQKSNNFYLDKVMAEILENNTLANWVKETNERINLV